MSPPVGPYIVDIVKVKAIFHGVLVILQNICSYTIKTGRRLLKKKQCMQASLRYLPLDVTAVTPLPLKRALQFFYHK